MKLYDYSVNEILLRMLRDLSVTREEIINFVLKSIYVSEDEVVKFLQEYEDRYPIDWDADITGEPIDPESEGIVPIDYMDD